MYIKSGTVIVGNRHKTVALSKHCLKLSNSTTKFRIPDNYLLITK